MKNVLSLAVEMTYALQITDLRKVYDNGFEALKGVSLTVDQGDFYALLGPNGAGKSTTIGILCSLVSKSSGSVQILGHDIDENFALAKEQLGVVPQEFNFSQFERVIDIITQQAGYYGIPQKVALPRAQHYLEQLGLWDKRFDQARMLSGGMKRRLMIARALVHNPKLLILDEPTAGVDIELRRSMWDFLRKINEEGTTIILTTHYLEEAESLCRNVGIINQGELVENTSIKALLSQLNKEHFILDVTSIPQPDLDLGYPWRALDDESIEVEVEKGQGVTALFAAIKSHGIEVLSMRNRANRLEELFVNLVEQSR